MPTGSLVFYFICCGKIHIHPSGSNCLSNCGERHAQIALVKIVEDANRLPEKSSVATYYAPGYSEIFAKFLDREFCARAGVNRKLVCCAAPWGAERHILGYLIAKGSPVPQDPAIGIVVFIEEQENINCLVAGYGGASTFNITSGTIFRATYPNGLHRRDM